MIQGLKVLRQVLEERGEWQPQAEAGGEKRDVGGGRRET